MTSRHHMAEVIGQKTLHLKDTHKLAREIAAYLLHEGRVSELESLMRDVTEYRAQHGVVEATAHSAYKLSSEVKTELKHIAKKQYHGVDKVLLDEVVDPEIIGGVRLELPEKQLDLSVRGRLAVLKRFVADGSSS